MSAEMIFYVLVDPFTQEPRYVGKTHEGLKTRMYFHMHKETHLPSSKWIHGLKRQGAAPIALELERIPLSEDHWSVTERFWVQYFKFMGANLTNRQFNGVEHLRNRTTPPKGKRGSNGYKVNFDVASRGSLKG